MTSSYGNFLLILFGGFLTAFLTTWLVIQVLTRYAEPLGLIDKPDHRKIHVSPIPRIGGLGLFAGLMMGLLYFSACRQAYPGCAAYLPMPNSYFITGGIVIAVTGLVDDFKGISFRQKLVAQCLIAVYVILAGYRLQFDFGILIGYTELLSIPVTFLWIIGVINALNLIDGMDGLAGGIFLITMIMTTVCYAFMGISLEVVLMFSIVGALMGFLSLNYHPAKVFMGDTGSLFLGYVVACYTLQVSTSQSNYFTFAVPALLVGLPVFDTLLSMVRRYLKGRPLFYPDKDHMHHRVRKVFGGNQRLTVLRLYSINLTLGTFGVLLSISSNWIGVLVIAVALAYCVWVVWRLRYFKLEELFRKRAKPKHRGLLSTGGVFPYRF
ncbi:MAG: MraY family glycosyltransferase [Verrucomicrobiota bacterium]